MTAEQRQELERLRLADTKVTEVSTARMMRRVELERMDAAQRCPICGIEHNAYWRGHEIRLTRGKDGACAYAIRGDRVSASGHERTEFTAHKTAREQIDAAIDKDRR